MRKKRVIVLLLIVCMITCACSHGRLRMINRDEKIAKERIEQILDAIQEKDEKQFLALFSADVCNKMPELNESTDKLFSYFQGTVVSHNAGEVLGVTNTQDDGEIFQSMEQSVDVLTTESEYRIAILDVTKDTKNENNIGIQSIYIIKMQDDVDPEYAYWGDIEFASGIHIAVPNAIDKW